MRPRFLSVLAPWAWFPGPLGRIQARTPAGVQLPTQEGAAGARGALERRRPLRLCQRVIETLPCRVDAVVWCGATGGTAAARQTYDAPLRCLQGLRSMAPRYRYELSTTYNRFAPGSLGEMQAAVWQKLGTMLPVLPAGGDPLKWAPSVRVLDQERLWVHGWACIAAGGHILLGGDCHVRVWCRNGVLMTLTAEELCDAVAKGHFEFTYQWRDRMRAWWVAQSLARAPASQSSSQHSRHAGLTCSQHTCVQCICR